ncbi:MAG: hypothetical protein SF182_09460 [Deltaproteobacteria bacterium]|nr:hypothetical protein [Deltaproteobacteria bacterium]
MRTASEPMKRKQYEAALETLQAELCTLQELDVWPLLFAGGLVFFLAVEAEKLIIRSTPSLRRGVTAVEAGQ